MFGLLFIIGFLVFSWYVGVTVFDIIFGAREPKDSYTIHNHYHIDNRQVHLHESNKGQTLDSSETTQ